MKEDIDQDLEQLQSKDNMEHWYMRLRKKTIFAILAILNLFITWVC